VNTYLLFTMIRSGNHALTQWMYPQLEGDIHTHICAQYGWAEGQLRSGTIGSRDNSGDYTTDTGHHVYTFEDEELTGFKKYSMQDMEQLQGKTLIPIVLIRDPYNWLASCLYRDQRYNDSLLEEYDRGSLVEERPGSRLNGLETYKQYAAEAMGHTKLVDHPAKVIVKFNDWFSSISYRKLLSKSLRLNKFSDEGLNKVTKYGNGSSFDNTNFNGKAQEMNVLSRWHQMKPDTNNYEAFSKAVSDPDIQDIARELFNMEPLKLEQ